MDSNKLAAVLATIDTGSLSAAAELLGYTPSGVSRMVEAVEADMGFALFERMRRGMVLTPSGASMLPALRQLAQAQAQIDQRAADIRGAVVGEITVGTYYSTAMLWLPAILAEFKTRHPGVHVKIVEAGNVDLAEGLVSRRIDCSLEARREGPGEFISLYRDQMVVWAPRDHEFAGLKSVRPRMLEGQPFIMPLPGTDNDVERYLAANGVRPNVVYSSRDNATVFALVEAGLGVSMNNALMSRKISGDVAEIPLDPPYEIDLGISVLSLEAAGPATQRFVSCAQEVVARLV